MKKITFILFLFCTVLYAQDDNYSIKNIAVNTEYSDFGTTYYGDSTVIYASTKPKKRTIRNRIWKQNDQPYLQLYTGVLSSEGEIEDSKEFSKKINTRYHESNVSFTNDLQTVYFSRDNSLNGKKVVKDAEGWVLIQLYKATVSESGEWSNITAMPFNDDNYQTGHPSLNAAEDKLYFTSDMPGGYGMTDIYVVAINSDGTYGVPKNLGPIVNTPNKEMFPFMNTNNILYYSSDRADIGLGGLDIYATKSKGENGYFEPVNLGYPLNSLKDDFSITYQKNQKTGHFSSNRDGGHGDDDIYYFEDLKPVNFDCNQIVTGVVRDKNTKNLLPGSQVVLFKGETEIERVIVGSDAAFKFAIDCETSYKVVGTKDDYNDIATETFTTNNESDLELTLELMLGDKKPDEFVETRGKLMIKIDPIYFDFDKSNIRSDAQIELAKVISVMQRYPALIIEGGSHTDSRGSDSYNESLSARRAAATVAYIMSVGGIDSSRISSRGYGESQLTNQCSNGVKCTKDEHQLNRRTEFVILNPEVVNQ